MKDASSTIESTVEVVRALREQLGMASSAQGSKPREDRQNIFSCGCTALDQLLPQGGFVWGQLIEWLNDRAGSGVESLVMLVARQACQHGGALVVSDPCGTFYPPAAALWGIDLKRLIVIRTSNARDELWAVDQALRSSAVAAVLASLRKLDSRWFRRFQLAAESGQTLGMLMRPAHVRGQPSWSDAQLLVHPQSMLSNSNKHFPCAVTETQSSTKTQNDRFQNDRLLASGALLASGTGTAPAALNLTDSQVSHEDRYLRVEVVRCRGGTNHGIVEVKIEQRTGTIQQTRTMGRANQVGHETHTLHLASQLANPTPRRRSARA